MRLALALVVVVGCGSKDSGEQAKPAAPAAPAEPAGCEIAVTVTADAITYDGGGLRGSVARDDDLSALRPAAHCTAVVDAAPGVVYQDVVTTMDALLAQRFGNIGLAGLEPTKPRKPPPKFSSKVNPDGTITMTLDEPAEPPALSKAPVIIVTTTGVTIGSTEIALDDPALAKKVGAAMPPTEYNALVILQADATLPYQTIVTVAKGANAAGHGDLMFAVKNR